MQRSKFPRRPIEPYYKPIIAGFVCVSDLIDRLRRNFVQWSDVASLHKIAS